MAQFSKIEWTDHTFNPWIGCTKVSPGCANCYAEARDKRFYPQGEDGNGFHWGPGRPRQRTSAANWKQPLKWNGLVHELCSCESGNTLPDGMCDYCGLMTRRPRVFCGSLCDVFDPEVPWILRNNLFVLIEKCKNLDWLLLTKRPENVMPMLEQIRKHWMADKIPLFENIWIGTTVENQEQANKRIPELLKIPAKIRFLSCEPLLGPVDLSQWTPYCTHASKEDLSGGFCPCGFQWVIVGGESGPKARPMHPEWARSLRDQCKAAGVPFLFKQWGEWVEGFSNLDQCIEAHETFFTRIGKKAAGRLLDGVEHNEFPVG